MCKSFSEILSNIFLYDRLPPSIHTPRWHLGKDHEPEELSRPCSIGRPYINDRHPAVKKEMARLKESVWEEKEKNRKYEFQHSL